MQRPAHMRFAVLGDRVHHSLSPLLHNAVARHLQAGFSYSAHALDEQDFDAFMQQLKRGETPFAGCNVTIPYKEKVLRYCDELSPLARRLGSVNTLSLVGTKLRGDNTDWLGFYAGLHESLGKADPNLPVGVIGTGGVARACVDALAEFGFRRIIISSRSITRAEEFIAGLSELRAHSGVELEACEGLSLNESYALIVNTSPLGFHDEDPLPLSLELLSRTKAFFDLVYRKGRKSTRALALASNLGLTTISGERMLIAQARESEAIWNEHFGIWGKSAPLEAEAVMSEIMEQASDKHHLAFIGFMGSGKSTLARMLARSSSYTFVDLDLEIAAREGMSVSEIFTHKGEERFRQLEHDLLAEYLRRRKPYLISCGGGITSNPANQELLSTHAQVVYLEMKINELYRRLVASHKKYPEKRPLLKAGLAFSDIEKRFLSREKGYLQCADIVLPIASANTREESLKLLLKSLKLEAHKG